MQGQELKENELVPVAMLDHGPAPVFFEISKRSK